MSMTRRGFIAAITASLAAPAAALSPLDLIDENGLCVLRGKTLVLSKPIVLPDCPFLIESCHFEPADDFPFNEPLIDARASTDGVIKDCSFDLKYKASGVAVKDITIGAQKIGHLETSSRYDASWSKPAPLRVMVSEELVFDPA